MNHNYSPDTARSVLRERLAVLPDAAQFGELPPEELRELVALSLGARGMSAFSYNLVSDIAETPQPTPALRCRLARRALQLHYL